MAKPVNHLNIDGVRVGKDAPTYFIADIAANHDGDLQRAIALIQLAAEAGTNAAKFQHFSADTIVSEVGFESLNEIQGHQAKWQKSVVEVYQDASLNLNWTPYLKKACDEAGIAFFSTPYALDIVDAIDRFVPAYKIGSGDITWLDLIEHIAKKNKPYILATGASTLQDVKRAVEAGLTINQKVALLQCNTNYTGSLTNFNHVALNVLRTYREMYPEMVLGLSDHTPGHATVLGAVALGARIIEKHFTDDVDRVGPDHGFSMNAATWREMVDRARELESSLGATTKIIEDNEKQTVIVQRRAVRLNVDVPEGATLSREMLVVLRPCPEDALPPYKIDSIIGKRVTCFKKAGDYIKWNDIK
jgi:sialic acid synthase SpsE